MVIRQTIETHLADFKTVEVVLNKSVPYKNAWQISKLGNIP